MDKVNKMLSVLKTNPYASAVTSLFLVLYANKAAPALPASLMGMMEHKVVKFLMMFLIMVLVKGQTPKMSMVVVVGFVLSLFRLGQVSGMMTSDQTMSAVAWGSDDSGNHVTLRGQEYTGHDEPNHLPGGHGDEPSGYEGESFHAVSDF